MRQIPIVGYETNYDITDTGKVFSKISGRYLTPTIDTDGYEIVGLYLNGVQKKKKVHRLVADAFVPNPNNYTQVNHKDENPRNNNANNLEWCEHLYNCNYGTRNIRAGAKNSRKVECIETKEIFDSVRQAAERYNVRSTAISNCINGRSKSCAGYTWRLANVHT